MQNHAKAGGILSIVSGVFGLLGLVACICMTYIMRLFFSESYFYGGFEREMMTAMAIYYFVLGAKRNDGSLRPIHFITKKGSCVDAEFPHSCTICTTTMTETICEAIWLALAPAKPEWATAAHGK